MIMFDPGRNINEERETRGMALGKTVLAKTLDLVEASLSKVARVAALDHLGDHLLLKLADGARTAESSHGLSQLVDLGIVEARRDHGNAHRLLLEERHA